MVQEPHCLNTSILDCSVTFTVDKDVWVHGIEVPSQVTDVPEELTVRHVIVVVIIMSILLPSHYRRQLSLSSLSYSFPTPTFMEMMEGHQHFRAYCHRWK